MCIPILKDLFAYLMKGLSVAKLKTLQIIKIQLIYFFFKTICNERELCSNELLVLHTGQNKMGIRVRRRA